MKKIFFIVLFSGLLFAGCKSSANTATENINSLELVDAQRYSFRATTALPSGYKNIPLSYGYFLTITKDSIVSFLPYFGRAYSAPMPNDKGGIMFTSTDFKYVATKKSDSRKITVKTNDLSNNAVFYIDISKSGYATLSVQDPNRRQISFYGTVEDINE
ncbi:MAG: DUF4251 domain-containing protein [Dysgonomonas sp.]